MKYIIVHPCSNKNKICVVDIDFSYEKDEFCLASGKEFHDRDEAIKHARNMANNLYLEYELFDSRYSDDREYADDFMEEVPLYERVKKMVEEILSDD